jgi:SnoaL-like domain
LTQHLISNIEVHLEGDRAEVRAMFYNPMQLPGMDEMSFCGGYYHHDMVRTPDGWKSQHLVEENVWFVNQPGQVAP